MKAKTACLIMLMALSLRILAPAVPVEDEYIRKVVLFKQLSQYITWPETAGIKDKSKPFVIGIAGRNPFGDLLERAYSGKTIKNKKIRIISASTVESIQQCHILFVSKTAENDLPRIISVTSDKPVFTMGETPGFAEKGILLNLYISEGKIRFEINGSMLRKSSLTIDPLLLRVARVVTLPEPGK